MRWILVPSFILLCSVITRADQAAGTSALLSGLDALESRRWNDAATAFTSASQAADENAEYHLLRAATMLCTGDSGGADEQLERAQRLGGKNEALQKWLKEVDFMRADAHAASAQLDERQYQPAEGDSDFIKQTRAQLRQRDIAKRDQARASLENEAVQLAHEVKAAHPELRAMLMDRVRANFAAGKIDEMFNDLGLILQAEPNNVDAIYHVGAGLNSKGYSIDARENLTRALTLATAHGAAYAQRAISEIRIGNLARARQDLKLAEKYDAAAAKAIAPLFEKEMAAYKSDPASDSPQQKWDALKSAVDSGSTADQATPIAIEMVKAQSAHRLRWDELYQDRLRQLEDAVREQPRNIERLLALGEFVYHESDIDGERPSPGAPFRPFRKMDAAEGTRELEVADKIFDQVLAIDPQNVRAMTLKAAVQLEHGMWNDGEAWVNRALALHKDTPELLELLTRVLDKAASARSWSAQDLRTPKTWWTSGLYYSVQWTRQPSQQELNDADALSYKANQMWKAADAMMRRAAQSSKGTPDGLYFQALLLKRNEQYDEAAKCLEQAVQLDPTSKRNREMLARVYTKLNRAEDAARQREIITLQRQTTATARLAEAWTNLDRTAYESAQKCLDEARNVDPADSRVPAYEGVLCVALKKQDEVIKWFTMALAINQARAKIGGFDLAPDAKSYIPPAGVATAMVLNLRMGTSQRETNAPDAAIAAFRRNIALAQRVPQQAWAQQWPECVLPNLKDPQNVIAPSIDGLFAWSQLMAGNTLVALGKYDDAYDAFHSVAQNPHAKGPVDSNLADQPTNDPHIAADADAKRMYWAKNDPVASRRPRWLAGALMFKALTGDELRVIGSVQTNSQQSKSDTEYEKFQKQQQDAYMQQLRPEQRKQYQQQIDAQKRMQEQRHQAQSHQEEEQKKKADPEGWPSGPANEMIGWKDTN